MASRIAITLGFALTLTGCTDRPKAPPLVNDAVFTNEKAGIRMLAPPGWALTSRSDLPIGPLPKPILIASYVKQSGEKQAEFDIIANDLADGTDITRYLAEYRIGPEKWTSKPVAESVMVGGEPASRVTLTRGTGKDEVRREASAVRRGSRAIMFIMTCPTRDTEQRDQVRQCLDSVTWTK